MSKPIYNSDGININLDCKVTQKSDGTYLFELKNDAIKFFNEKVYGKYNEASAVVSCTIKTEQYKNSIVSFLESKDCEIEHWTDLSSDFVENWNAQFN